MAISQNEYATNTKEYYWDYLVKNPDEVKQKIAMVYAGRSGSMMLSGLLEGHTQLISFNCYSDARLYNTLKELAAQENLSIDSFKKCLMASYDSILDIFYKHPLLPSELISDDDRLNINSFMSVINQICDNLTDNQINLDMMLNIVFIAYGKSRNRPLNTKNPIMIIQLHSPFLMDGWKYLFDYLKNLQVIIMMRNPIKSLDSHFYHHMHELPSPPWSTFYERIILEFKKSILPIFDSQMQTKTYFMFFEDIHSNPKSAMLAFCKHLNIPFENVLLEETVEGKKAQFTTAGQQVSGTSKDRGRNKALRSLSASDVNFIEYLFGDFISDLGYKLNSISIQRKISPYFLTTLEALCANRESDECINIKYLQEMQTKNKIKRKLYSMRSKVRTLRMAFNTHKTILKIRIKKNVNPYMINIIKSY